ncbi:hypothetical protein BDB00DRAFT_873311 [Zychaea mexicana]|uniref:uncharacterized protein n=1 Tax=Zychaea mexicana TaxID=64656 RepID=UPI0022FE929D|nr:uncharacterized protein BDB00DRAFT_873311 [Zychaea mexicana]KAI9492552.1 hypothetical protein BDB00DRAFT_873311 [Zychaea mexicana]
MKLTPPAALPLFHARVHRLASSKTIHKLEDALTLETECLIDRLLEQTLSSSTSVPSIYTNNSSSISSDNNGDNDHQEQCKGVDVLLHLNLFTMNYILVVGFGKRAESMEDPLFRTLLESVEEPFRHFNIIKDLKTYLPLVSFLIEEALDGDVDCLVKQLSQLEQIDHNDALVVAMSDLGVAGSDTTAVIAS